MRWRPPFPRLTLLVVALLGSVLVVLLAEGVTRLVAPQWRPPRAERVIFWQHDQTLGWKHRPGQHGRFRHRDFDVEVRINSEDLRDDEYSHERTAKKRMLVLGDSFAWGFGVEAQERFSELVEAARPDWEVVNAAVSGYGTDQEYLYLRDEGVRYSPDLVLLLFCSNDVHNNVCSQRYWYFKPFYSVEDDEHWNAAGHEVAAEAIGAFLFESRIEPSRCLEAR